MRTRRALTVTLLAALAAALSLVLAACGGSSGSDQGADPAKIAPASTPLYIEATVHPQGDQQANLDGILKKVLRKPDPSAEIQRLIDQAGSKDGVTYKRDIAPWLGDRVGVVVLSLAAQSPPSAVIAAATDTDKARAALKKGSKTTERSYHGVTYDFDTAKNNASGVIAGYAVAGDEPAVKAIIDASKSEDKGLAKSTRYQAALNGAASNRLGFLYADPDLIVQSSRVPAQAQGILKQFLGGAKLEPIVATLQAQQDALAVESRAKLGGALANIGGKPVPLLSKLPGDSWAALGVGDFGATIKQGIQLVAGLGVPGLTPDSLRSQLRSQTGLDLDRDLLGWIGDLAFFVRGTTPKDIGGGVVISSKDPAASERAIAKIGKLVAQQAHAGGFEISGSGSDFTIHDKSVPQPIRLVAKGDKVVIAYGEAAARAALAPTATLGEAQGFREAEGSLGAGVAPAGFVSFPAILDLVRSSGGANSGFEQARPYLEALSNIAFGSKRDGDNVVSRFVVGVK